MPSGLATLWGKRSNAADLAWCASPRQAAGESKFESVCALSDGGAVAVGYIAGNAPTVLSETVQVQASSVGTNFLVVRYGTTGEALWAVAPKGGNASSSFEAVVADASGGIFAAGEIWGKQVLDLGNGVTVQGGSDHSSTLIVHFNARGEAIWAKSLEKGNGSAKFSALALGELGILYAAGGLSGTDAYQFGNKIVLQGASVSWTGLLVAYSPVGKALWGATLPGAIHGSFFNAVEAVGKDLVVVGGSVSGDDPVVISTKLTLHPSNPMSARHYMASGETTGNNALLVAYSTKGEVEWALTPGDGQGESAIKSLAAVDELIFAAGYLAGAAPRSLGNQVRVAAPGSDIACLIFALNRSGAVQWARSVEGQNEYSMFNGVCVLESGLIVAAGRANGQGWYRFSETVRARGRGSDSNALFATFTAEGEPKAVQLCQSSKGYSVFGAVAPLRAMSNQAIVASGRVKADHLYHFGGSLGVQGGFPTGQNAMIFAFRHTL